MLKWAVIVIGIAIIAAILGFTGLVIGVLADIAQVLFWVFLALFVLTLIFGRRVFT